jgi:hypothetical protein
MEVAMSDETVEIDVDLIHHHNDAMLVSDGDIEVWVPYSLVDEDESTITRQSKAGESGTVVIPEWKAVKLGLV